MGNNALDNMLFKLFKTNKTAIIPFDSIVKSFNSIGERYDTERGKWIEPKIITEKSILLKGFIPKGERYTDNVHPDANEIVTVISGKIRNVHFKLNKTSMGQFSWKAGVVHDLLAKEDSLFYALITKV